MDSSAEVELARLRISINECRTQRDAHEHQLHSLERIIEDRSMSLDAMEKQIDSIQRQLSSYCREIDAKERELHALCCSVEERSVALEAMVECMKSVQNQIGECERDLRLKEQECNWQLDRMDRMISERDEVHKEMERAIEVCGVDLDIKENMLCVVKGLILEREQELQVKHAELNNVHRDCEWKKEELRELFVRIGDCNEELKVKEEEVNSIEVKIKQLVEELESNKREFDSLRRLMREERAELEKKERKLQEGVRDLESMKKQFEGQVKEFEKQCGGQAKELKAKERTFEGRVEEFESIKNKFEGRVAEFESKEKQFEGQAKELESKEKQFEGQVKEFESKEKQLVGQLQELESKRKQFEEQVEEFDLKQEHCERQMNEFESEEKQFKGRVEEFELREKQFEEQAKELKSKEKKFEGQVKELESKQKQLEGQLEELESKRKQFEEQVKEFDSKQEHCEGQMKEFESKQNRFNIEVMVHKSKEKKLEVQKKMLESKEKQHDVQVQELKAKEKQFEVQAKELESKEKDFEGQVKDLESEKNQFVAQMKAIEIRKAMLNRKLEGHKSKEQQLEAQMKDLESKMNQYEEQVEGHELKESQFRLALKQLGSEEKQFEGRLKDLQSKQNQLGRQQKELELKEKQFESLRKSFQEGQELKEKSNILLRQVKAEPQDFTDADSVNNCKNLHLLFNLLKNYDSVCSQVSDALRTSSDPSMVVLGTIKGFCPPQLRQELAQRGVNLSRRMHNLLIDELKKSSPVISSHVKQEAITFANDWKASIAVADTDCLEVLDFLKFVATYEISSSFNEHGIQLLLDIISQHCQAPQALGNIEKLADNQISPTTADGRNLQLLSNEHVLIDNHILACLQTSADPAFLVLDIIQNPIVPQDRKGNEGVLIDESHTILLDQLMRISPSPPIKPHIRDAAKKLATDLKANMNPCDENSLVVLGFLLLLSIYGLVSYFDEDEVFKLLEFAAPHKQAIELFRTLGFADKIAVFVQNLVEKKQYVDAARFICAYKLAYKIDPADLLRFQVSRANWLFTRTSSRKKPIEQKVRCKEQELGILGKVLQCISYYNLVSQDLVNETQDRILLLERQKEALIVLGKQKEELSRLVSELSSALQGHQPEEKKCANEEFTENQVQQPEEKISADIVVTENRVKMPQLKEKESANEAVTMNQVQGQQHEENISTTNEAVTMNEVQVHQPRGNVCTNEAVTINQEKKRPIEAMPNNHQLHQSGHDIKRPRTAARHSVPPPVSTPPQYQHTFTPSGMPAQFGLPPYYYYGVPYPPGGGHSGTNYFCYPRPYPPFR